MVPNMLPTYPAVLRAGQLDWGADGPPALPPDTPIPVHVTLLAPLPTATSSGSKMAAALAAIAASGGPSGFGDPVEWQLASRADRAMPGREE